MMSKIRAADAVVIGGGIIGVSAAYFLARQGRKVTLIERKSLASEASGANMGLVVHITKKPGILLRMVEETVKFYRNIQAEGVDLEYTQPGAFVVYETEAEERAGLELVREQQAWGLPVRNLPTSEILAMEPTLARDLPWRGGAFCDIDGHLNPFKATIGIGLAAKATGAEILTHTEVFSLKIEHGRVRGVETTAGPIQTDLVVNAAGSWSAAIAEMAGERLPVVPARGQVMVTEPMPHFMKYHVLGTSARQTRHGSILIGSQKEYVGYDRQNDPLMLRQFAQCALRRYPVLRQVRVVRTWANFRPATPDEKPIIAKSSTVDGLIHATGHYSMGMGYGPATGMIVAGLAAGETAGWDLAELSLERFSA